MIPEPSLANAYLHERGDGELESQRERERDKVEIPSLLGRGLGLILSRWAK